MKFLGIIFLVICISESFARFHQNLHPYSSHQHQHSHPHSNPIAQYILSKLQSILSWLSSKDDSTAFDYIYTVNKGLGLNLYQGDIRGHNTNSKHKRAAIRTTAGLWTSRTIPYTFDPAFDSNGRRIVLKGIKEFHNKTCLRFVPRTTEQDFINFNQNQGCSSEIGRKGSRQDVSLMSSCLIQGTVVHEIMHAIGFYHEQGRPDRDSWIQIMYTNIESGKEYNFNKESPNDVTTLGLQYDYGSVMHYSKYAFTKNGGPTILPIFQTNARLGQRSRMSDLDAKKINKLYQCGQGLSTLPTIPQKIPTKIPVKQTESTTVSTTTHHSKDLIRTPPTLLVPKLQTTSQPVPTPSPPIPTQHGWTSWTTWSSCDLRCNRNRYRFCVNTNKNRCYGAKSQTEICSTACKPIWSLNCWRENSTDLAIPAAYGISKLTQSYTEALDAIKQCADYAAHSGYSVFALFNERICLTGPHAATGYTKHGPSNECGRNGLGGQSASNVYSLLKDIDGNWSSWSEWGVCSRTCGGGQQYRYRQCNNPAPTGTGAPCQGSDREYVSCNSMACKVEAKCGTKFHTGVAGTSGIISVHNYSNFMECEYEILTGDPNVTISLAITRLDIEYSSNCIYDALMVFDGSDSTANLIGAYCGKIAPSPIQSTTNKLFIKFESDETSTASGFDLLYTINNKQRKACVTPQVPAHSKLIGSTNFVGDRIVYQCENNYNLIGQSSITCVDQPGLAVWSDSFPYCMKNFKRSARKMQPKLCTFEDNLCGFTQDDSDNLDWKLYTATSNNLVPEIPLDDKTRGTSGHYFAAKSSRISNVGDTARVYTPVIYPFGAQCLHFFYQTNGQHGQQDGTHFNVYIRDGDDVIRDPLLEINTDTAYIWEEAKITINSDTLYQIVFEHVVGEKYGSFSAIDDVTITNGACQNSA